MVALGRLKVRTVSRLGAKLSQPAGTAGGAEARGDLAGMQLRGCVTPGAQRRQLAASKVYLRGQGVCREMVPRGPQELVLGQAEDARQRGSQPV